MIFQVPSNTGHSMILYIKTIETTMPSELGLTTRDPMHYDTVKQKDNKRQLFHKETKAHEQRGQVSTDHMRAKPGFPA